MFETMGLSVRELRKCPTCEAPAGSANFGGQCDACDAKRRVRNARAAALLRAGGREMARSGIVKHLTRCGC